MRRSAVAVALTMAASACGVSEPAPAELVGCLNEYADVKEAVAAELSSNSLQDAALIIRVDGQTVCRLSFGAIRPDSAVAIASAAKWLTAGAILALFDAGKIRLNTMTSELFPTAPPATANITMSQLLSHTSGLLWFSRCMGKPDDTLQRCAETILEGDLHFEPGTGFFYAGPPFTVAGAMAELALDRRWAEIFRTTIAQPLGMSSTSYGDSPNPALSEGDVVSSADDYVRFAQMILDKGRYQGHLVLSDEAIQQMRRNWSGGVPIVYSPRGELPYGLGTWLDEGDAEGNGTVLSSPGIGGFVPVVDYGRRMVVVLAAQDERTWRAIPAIMDYVRTAVDRER